MEKYMITLLPMLACLVGTSVILHFLIPVLKGRKMGQKILDIGPRWHKDKEGTPTMGGLSFLFTVTAVSTVSAIFLFYNNYLEKKEFLGIIITLSYALLNGFIGITDDIRKFKRGKNEGLTAKEKYFLQFILSIAYIITLLKLGSVSTNLYIPFLDISIELNFFWYIFALLFLTGFGNAVNLTDGIDGLCGSVTATVSVFFIAFYLIVGDISSSVFASALFGGCLGFLVYNLHPAKVFMGDTGSLFLGASVSGLALLSGNPLILFSVGIVYLIEALSVIIQVIFFKFTGKRVFLMAPIHHHFEKKGLSEGKITFIAVIFTVVFSVITFLFGINGIKMFFIN